MANRNVLTIAARMVGGKQIKKEAEEAVGGVDKLEKGVKEADKSAGSGHGWELFTKRSKEARKESEKHTSHIKNAARTAVGYAAGAGAAYGLFDVVKSSLSSVGETAGEVNKAQSLGITGSTSQTLTLLAAYKARGLGLRNLQMEAKTLAKSQLSAEQQERKYALAQTKAAESGKPLTAELGARAKAFQTLGINAAQFGKMGGAEQIKLINERMSALPPSLTKTRLATELLGRSGTQMLPVFTKGALGIGAMEKAAKEFLPSMKGGTSGMEEMELSSAKLSLAATGLKLRIGMALIPVLQAVMQWFTKLYSNIAHGTGAWKGIEKAIGTTAKTAWAFIGAAKEAVQWIAKSEVGAIALGAALVLLAGAWGVSKIAGFIGMIQKSTLFLALFGSGEDAVAAQSTLMWTAITGGAVLAIVGIVEVIKHWTQVKAFLVGIVSWISAHSNVLAFVPVIGPMIFVTVEIIKHWKGIVKFFEGLPTVFAKIGEEIWGALLSSFKWMVNSFIIAPINLVISAINSMATAYNDIPIHVGTAPHVKSIPGLAVGGIVRKGGSVVVGERGPEWLTLPPAARVDPLSSSRTGGLLPQGTWRGAGGDLVVSVQLDRKEVGRAVLREINAQQARRA
jgi:hypothetical protein